MSLNALPPIIEHNLHVAANQVETGHTLTAWVKEHGRVIYVLSEARTHYDVIKQFCHDNNYVQYQLPPGPDVKVNRNGQEVMLINEQGDEAILLPREYLKYVVKNKVVTMSKEWLVTGHNEWHTPRQYQILILKINGKKIRLRSSHWPTHGFSGVNKVAFDESARRSLAWLLIGLLSVSLDIGDLNQNITEVAKFYGPRFTVVGFGIDMLVGRNVKKVEKTVLPLGGSDHHGVLLLVWY